MYIYRKVLEKNTLLFVCMCVSVYVFFLLVVDFLIKLNSSKFSLIKQIIEILKIHEYMLTKLN